VGRWGIITNAFQEEVCCLSFNGLFIRKGGVLMVVVVVMIMMVVVMVIAQVEANSSLNQSAYKFYN
jgi:hypothetical protein